MSPPRYGHYSEEIFRACRMVVDTGIHALGWSWQEAVDFMVLHTASSQVNIEVYVDDLLLFSVTIPYICIT